MKGQGKTDLAGLKALCHRFLELDIKGTDMSPLIVKHPFTDSGFVGIRKEDGSMTVADLTKDTAALRTWREQLSQQIDREEKPLYLFLKITKSYILGFLKHAAPFLSELDVAQFLSHAWTMTEAPNHDPNMSKNELLALFRSMNPHMLMSEEEYALFHRLEDMVTIYRGVTPYNAENINALSWTLDRETAEWFAHRFGEQGTVYEAQINKEHIYAVFLARQESEVIVDPKYLMEISPVQGQAQRTDINGMQLL